MLLQPTRPVLTRAGDRSLDRACSKSGFLTCYRPFLTGCYDHSVYVLDLWTGNVVWKFDTNGIVKCAPCVDPATNAVCAGLPLLFAEHWAVLFCGDSRETRSL